MNHQILEDGLANDRGSLQQPELCITEGVANITLYKAWPDAHVSKSRRLMAIDVNVMIKLPFSELGCHGPHFLKIPNLHSDAYQ
ncbi:hypothetical protein BDZ45DRAFT_742970 [Acephala macrosclerotiorum]|nr:hypothetical protein BDZ45DRAFT_742970 [Acephala macrosclerotiorum]